MSRRRNRAPAGPMVKAATELRDKSPNNWVFVAPLYPGIGGVANGIGCRCRGCRNNQEALQNLANTLEQSSPGIVARVARWFDGLTDRNEHGRIVGFRIMAGATVGFYGATGRSQGGSPDAFDVVSEPLSLLPPGIVRGSRSWKDYSLRGNSGIRKYADRGALPTAPLTWLQACDIVHIAHRITVDGIRIGEGLALVSKSLMNTVAVVGENAGVWTGTSRNLFVRESCSASARAPRPKGMRTSHGHTRPGLMSGAATHVPYKDALKEPTDKSDGTDGAVLLSEVFRNHEFISCPTFRDDDTNGTVRSSRLQRTIVCDHSGCVRCLNNARMRCLIRQEDCGRRSNEAREKLPNGTPEQRRVYSDYGFIGDGTFCYGATPGVDVYLSVDILGPNLVNPVPAQPFRAAQRAEYVIFRGPVQFVTNTIRPYALSLHTIEACVESEEEGRDENPSPYKSRVWRTPIRGESARLVGLEVEFNESPPPAAREWAAMWAGHIHSDGSCGYEAVTPPVAGKYIYPCLKSMQRALRDCSADNRCGVHVHVEAADLGWYDIRRLLHVWRLVEPVMFLIAGQNRLGNRYCGQIGASIWTDLLSRDKAMSQEHILNLYGTSRAAIRSRPAHKKDSGRYKCLNLMPWLAQRRGNGLDTTIEFRLHRATLSADRLAHWAALVRNLVDWCVSHTDADATALPKSAARALATIAGSETAWVMARIKAWRNATTFVAVRQHAETDEAGNRLPRRAKRRIGVKGGAWRIITGTFTNESGY